MAGLDPCFQNFDRGYGKEIRLQQYNHNSKGDVFPNPGETMSTPLFKDWLKDALKRPIEEDTAGEIDYKATEKEAMEQGDE